METTRNVISILVAIALITSLTILYFSIRNLKIKTIYNLILFKTIISSILVGLYLSMTNYSSWYYILVIIWIANMILSFKFCCSLKEIIEDIEEYDEILKSCKEEEKVQIELFNNNDIYYDEKKEKLIIIPKIKQS